MIAIDTNVLIRYLVCDDAEQAEAARALLVELSSERPGFICREVTIEVVWVLERAYRLPRDEIATVLDELIATEGLVVEAADAVTQAASAYRQGSADFSDLMILAAAKRARAQPLYTFDRTFARLAGAALVESVTGGGSP